MAREVGLGNLGEEIGEIVGEWTEEAIEAADKVVAKDARELVKEISRTKAFDDSPKKGSLKDSFVAKRIDGGNSPTDVYAVYARKDHKYSIAHLVENGHVNYWRWGRRVPARHFLLPLSEKYADKLVKDVVAALGGRKGN